MEEYRLGTVACAKPAHATYRVQRHGADATRYPYERNSPELKLKAAKPTD